MDYGICHLSVIPVYREKDTASQLVNQILYGEHFKILKKKTTWCRIELCSDGMEGWIKRSQYVPLTKTQFQSVNAEKNLQFSSNLISAVNDGIDKFIAVPLGAIVSNSGLFGHHFEGDIHENASGKRKIVDTALHYLDVPELSGGRTPFGIDSSGLTQMAYRLHGFTLPRTAEAQAGVGEPLSFIEESEAGDLAFFDDKDGVIFHVGILLGDHRILHVNGRARIDRLDHTGIFNADEKKYSHTLRVIKKIQ